MTNTAQLCNELKKKINPKQINVTLLEYYVLNRPARSLTKYRNVYLWSKSSGALSKVMVWYRHAVSINPTAPDPKPPYPQDRSIDSTTLGPSHGALRLLFPMQPGTTCVLEVPALWSRYWLEINFDSLFSHRKQQMEVGNHRRAGILHPSSLAMLHAAPAAAVNHG